MRKSMKSVVVAVLCLAPPSVMLAGEASHHVTYDGGSLTELKAGTSLKLYIDSNQIRLVKVKTEVGIPVSAITEISYGQDVHRRVGTAVAVGLVSFGIGALTALSKSKEHYIGLTWAHGDQKGGLAMRCDKSDYRGILCRAR